MSQKRSCKLLCSGPYFPGADAAQSAEYYERVLGFMCEYVAGTDCAEREQGGTWDAFFWVDHAEELHRELVANGAEIVYGPIFQEAYRMQEFVVRDSDGHLLGFGQQIE